MTPCQPGALPPQPDGLGAVPARRVILGATITFITTIKVSFELQNDVESFYQFAFSKYVLRSAGFALFQNLKAAGRRDLARAGLLKRQSEDRMRATFDRGGAP